MNCRVKNNEIPIKPKATRKKTGPYRTTRPHENGEKIRLNFNKLLQNGRVSPKNRLIIFV